MNERTARLRQASLAARPSISHERARLLTEFYRAHEGKYSVPVMRARSFLHLCEHKTIYLGDEELIVGERGPEPKAVPTYPELTCHSVEDLRILNSRPKTSYAVSDETLRVYEDEIIPYWRDRSMRDKIFAAMSEEWIEAYEAGLYTEFMEQRAPGHTVLDDKIYRRGMMDFKRDIFEAIAALDFVHDPEAYAKREQLLAMNIACDAVILFAERHARLAAEMAAREADPARKAELEKIAEVCRRVPAHAPRDFHEALQAYWFCHLAVITELNGWDSFSPGHLDQHLLPFYRQGLADGTLTPERARELLEAFFVKFNNHTAPPKVGVTAAESGTYTDFANINLAGLLPDGRDGSNDLTHMLLDIIDEMHLLQPSSNLQLSRKTPDAVLKHALRVIRHGYGFPSIFNADAVIEEQVRQGKTLEDARAGGCSGCVETGAFGKEAYILTGYFNLVKVLELALHNGVDPRTGKQLGPRTGDASALTSFDDVFAAFRRQLQHVLEIKIAGNQVIERMYATLDARAVLVGHHGRLHLEGQGLQRRRRTLQPHLHPVCRHRQLDGQPVGRAPAGVRRRRVEFGGIGRGPGCGFRQPGTAAAEAAAPHAQVRQRRRRCRRSDGPRLQRRRGRRGRPAEYQGRMLSGGNAADDVSRRISAR